VKTIIEHMAQTLASGERIEIRGFGSFSLHYRAPRIGRNPKTGESVGLSGKYVPHFKPGKELRERVNASMERYPSTAANTASDGDDDEGDDAPFAANAER
jgi:integration host factor, beta subunit